MEGEDRVCCGSIHSRQATETIAVIGLLLCVVAAALYYVFGVFRTDNFWVPALSFLYLFVFGCLRLAYVFQTPKLMHPFLVIQISVVGFTIMALSVFVLALSISWINGSSEFFEQREASQDSWSPVRETPWPVSAAGLTMLAYIEICTLAIPLILHCINRMKEEEWNQRRRKMAERRQQQHQQQLATFSLRKNSKLDDESNDEDRQQAPSKLPLAAVYKARLAEKQSAGQGLPPMGSVKSVSFNVEKDNNDSVSRRNNEQNRRNGGGAADGGGWGIGAVAAGTTTVVVIADDVCC